MRDESKPRGGPSLTARPSMRSHVWAAVLVREARAIAAAIAVVASVAAPAHADDAAAQRPVDFDPGSPRPAGLSLSPEAPPTPPAPGGRAPSFGAPTKSEQWSFQLGGRFSGFEAFGIGRAPANPPAGYSGTALHVPPWTQGRLPFFSGAGATINANYGNSIVTASVVFYASFAQQEFQGYYNPAAGPNFGSAYLTVTPPRLGRTRLQFRAGGFIENFGGPGQWGWGIFGPMLGLKGYGESANADIGATPDLQLSFEHGVMVGPGVPESFPRGDYQPWIETGVSSLVHHAHVGVTYKNQYQLRLHYASIYGTDERKYLSTALNTPPHDGRLDAWVAETRWLADPYGQVGVSGALYNFDRAASVGSGIWWAIDWTQGARELINKFLGPQSNGNGKVAALSAEYDFSLARILWYPRAFDGRAPDVRVQLAGLWYWTLASDDPAYERATGNYLGLDLEYRFSKWMSATLTSYGETRDSNLGRWGAYSVNPGIAFHSDWLSTDRIVITYSRRFYTKTVDNNPAQPLDRDVLAVGAYVTF